MELIIVFDVKYLNIIFSMENFDFNEVENLQ